MAFLGVNNKCSMIYGFLGFFIGLLIGMQLLIGGVGAFSGVNIIVVNTLFFGLLGLFVTGLYFYVRQRYNILAFFTSNILASLFIAFFTYYLATIKGNPYGEPFVMCLAGTLIGIVLAKLVCKFCDEKTNQFVGK